MRPVARLHTIIEALLQALMAPGTSAFLRMNLYASLSNYLQYVLTCCSHALEQQLTVNCSFCQQSILNVVGPTSQVAGFEDAQSAFRAFLQTDEVSALQKQLEQGNQQRLGAIGTENLNVGERLVELMSHDACNRYGFLSVRL